MSTQYFTDSVQSTAQGLDEIRSRSTLLFAKLAVNGGVTINRVTETVTLQDELARFRSEELAAIMAKLDRQTRERLVWIASVVESPAYVYELMTVVGQAEADDRAAQAVAKRMAELDAREKAVAADEKLVAQAIEAQSEAIRNMRAAMQEAAAATQALQVARDQIARMQGKLDRIEAVLGY